MYSSACKVSHSDIRNGLLMFILAAKETEIGLAEIETRIEIQVA